MPGNILQGYFGPFPSTTQAYAKDNAGNDYFGECSRGADSTRARWSIAKTLYQGTAGAWITQFAIAPNGIATDAPIFVWANATDGTIKYATLGTSTGS